MTKKEERFLKTVWDFYAQRGRAHLPWRQTRDPYKILVSEVMLQQTQVERVIPKYNAFLKRFPDVQTLSDARLVDVLSLWQGLGYNRRAKMLWLCAQQTVALYNGVFPNDAAALCRLPGIGPYTAGAIMAFAFNTAVPIIETNIRTVYLYHFFKNRTDVPDFEITRYIVRTLDAFDPRGWYYALMDYGAYIKQTQGNQNNKSKHYTRQSPFKGSDRQIRGAIVKALLQRSHTRLELLSILRPFDDSRVDAQTQHLIDEGLVVIKRNKLCVP